MRYKHVCYVYLSNLNIFVCNLLLFMPMYITGIWYNCQNPECEFVAIEFVIPTGRIFPFYFENMLKGSL